MSASIDISHEFDSLVKELHEDPDNAALKQAVMSRLPEMMELSKTNPIALYRLAKINPTTSDAYKNMMRKSAAMGCTNAMLDISKVLLSSDSISEANLRTAAHYLTMIARTKNIAGAEDSFMITESKTLLAAHPEVAALMKAEFKSDSYNINHFFSKKTDRAAQSELEVASRLTI